MRANMLKEMLQTIEQEARQTAPLTGRSSFAPRVMTALKQVPRDAFVPPDLRDKAFVNGPLPIGQRQTISQPYIVALMTDLLEPQPTQTILEIGTGSGYQAAILAQLAQQIYSLEIIPTLAKQATVRLQKLGYHNVEVKNGDGHNGWPEHAPYDGIIVTAAATHLPQTLLQQLKWGGRLVIPIGQAYLPQKLLLVVKNQQGEAITRDLLDVAFVPMTGGVPADREYS